MEKKLRDRHEIKVTWNYTPFVHTRTTFVVRILFLNYGYLVLLEKGMNSGIYA